MVQNSGPRFDIFHPSLPSQRFFSHEELMCKATGRVVLAPGFAPLLAHLRAVFAKPMHVNSCCRSKEYNTEIDGHPRSLHVYDKPYHPIDGTAGIDIRRGARDYNVRLVKVAIAEGWSIGVAKWGFHLDRRDLAGLPQTIFGYG